MLDFLGELERNVGDEARSLYLPPGLPSAEVEAALKEASGLVEIPPELAKCAASSKTGAALFCSPERRCLVLPPFPVAEKRLTHSLATEPLHSLIKRDYMIALILVRLGAYAIGICAGENLVSSKVGTGLVHGRHRKGGSSAHRFERHRDKQIEYFLSRVCRHAQEQLKPQAPVLDYMVYGGAWTTVELLQKQCPFLGRLDKRVLPPLLEIPEPRQAVLATAVNRVWSSSVMEWREE
jgi:hypothetical protein